jgi:cell division protein FtsQ
LAERKSPPAGAVLTTRPARRNGFWYRPQLLDLASDALLLFAAIGLGWALVTWTLSRPLFPLRELVLIEPPAQVTQAQLEYVTRTAIQGNFFTARLEDVRLAFEKLPWVRHAEVRRRWPDGLELRIEEHEAVAYWKTAGDYSDSVRLVNRYGEVFDASSDDPMPELSGPQGTSAAVLERYETYSTMLKPLQMKLVDLELSARGAWQLKLDDGMTIVLGRERESAPLDARLADFVSVWPRLKNEPGLRVARADLRYSDGFALVPMDNKTAPQTVVGIDRK